MTTKMTQIETDVKSWDGSSNMGAAKLLRTFKLAFVKMASTCRTRCERKEQLRNENVSAITASIRLFHQLEVWPGKILPS